MIYKNDERNVKEVNIKHAWEMKCQTQNQLQINYKHFY